MAIATEKTMMCAVETGKDRALSKGIVEFGKIVEKGSGGGIKVRVFTDGVLGGDRQALEELQMGTVQCASISASQVAVFVPQFGVFDLPFVFKDEQTAFRVTDGPIGQELLDKLPAAGLLGLNFWTRGYNHLSNSRHEVKTLKDVKGLKIRAMESTLQADAWKVLGASLVPMPGTQVSTALKEKRIDGQESALGDMVSSNSYEVQRFLTLTGHTYNANPLILSQKFWNTLSDKEKTLVRRAAKEAQAYQRQLEEKEKREATAVLMAKGVKLNELNVGEREKIRVALKPVYDKYTESVGSDWVNRVATAGEGRALR
jgi:tripartite ATP-independent transporter DctP family solute receptor